MKQQIVGMLAETFVHPGSGQSTGAIDFPVAREAGTDYPFMAGSSLKGALRDNHEQHGGNSVEEVFGKQENAGNLLVSDARLLLLPVRSLSSAYKWVTCPHLLERFKRDAGRSGDQDAGFTIPSVGAKEALGKDPNNGKLFLEERSFTGSGDVPEEIVSALQTLIPHEDTRARLPDQLTVVSDDAFSWFARYGLSVQARNVLTDQKTSKNLWYEETLPPDTLMYAVLAERNGGTLKKVREANNGYLQAGGNETVGQGWFALSWREAGS